MEWKTKTEGILAALLLFGQCQVQNSPRLTSFWSCQLPFFLEVSQNCFVLDLSGSTSEGSLAELLPVREVGRERSSSDRAGVEDRDKKAKGH